MSIEALKEKARRHEQNEEWREALLQYNRALAELARDEQVDIGLYNRVGDLYVRTGDLGQAVEHYEKAVDLYREADLPNNAIAVCKKIVRSVPNRPQAYLQMGQIRAEQGFLPDARTHFLTYAERMQQAGQLDESFRALIEFCDLAPEDVGVRVTVAEQMAASGRGDEAVEQLLIARKQFLEWEDQEQADAVEAKVLEIDPTVDFAARDAAAEPDWDEEADAPTADGSTSGELDPFGQEDADELFTEFQEIELEASPPPPGHGDEESEEAEGDIPFLRVEEEPGETGAIDALPLLDFGDVAGTEEAPDLPMLTFDEVAEADAESPPASAALEEALEETERPAPAESPVPPSPSRPPPPGGYVDLGAMILGDEDERSTRFTVPYEEPTGDEEADFARMLAQFKDKVSEGLDANDVRAHYDLGTAYKEMGLLDEAIGQFQAALRASADHLPTYELMGQTFMEMGRPQAAVRALRRALDTRTGVEDELVGIYYYLARAYEELDDRDSAVEYYDRVFELDINFGDVTERLRALR